MATGGGHGAGMMHRGVVAVVWALAWWGAGANAAETGKIDRPALVARHHPTLTAIDPWAPLTVGNGQFCFTADVTGLQTFYEHYRKNGIPLETQARWAWHTNANPAGHKLEDAHKPFTAYGRTQGYPTDQGSPAGRWLRENPHAWPLGRLGFTDARGEWLRPEEIAEVRQELNLWTGELRSRFTWRGAAVEVSTVCDPDVDRVVARVASRALADGTLRVRLAFPRGHDVTVKNNPGLDWSEPGSHRTEPWGMPGRWSAAASGGQAFSRGRDGADYMGILAAKDGDVAAPRPEDPHSLAVVARAGSDALEISLLFAGQGEVPDVDASWVETRNRSAGRWEQFWRSGAAVDFAGSTDPRAHELERRVVLSQYLTAVQFGGDFPPSETGLTLSSWYQKHHTEMIWWHAAHFSLWGRDAYLANLLGAYVRALPRAREIARGRGLDGARWPKMVGPDWRESPGGNPLIVWNQPHPIHLAELLWRAAPTAATLAAYGELVQETAAGMASMLQWDEGRRRWNLGPPLWIAQEIHDPATSMNPTYELSYWIRGLTLAQQWRERRGLARDAEWDRRIAGIARLPVKDGKYVAIESVPDTWDNVASRHDHPSFLMALGQLPGDGVDRATMARTLDAVLTTWDWETKIWGWDYPMVAMTAARLGEPKKAVDVLLKSDGPNNRYTANGHNPQRSDLPVYLPGNGALLAAVAMMAGGWDGAPSGNAPGFPADGTWTVRSEGLRRLP